MRGTTNCLYHCFPWTKSRVGIDNRCPLTWNSNRCLLTDCTVGSVEACNTVTLVIVDKVGAGSIVLTWLGLTFVNIWEESPRVWECERKCESKRDSALWHNISYICCQHHWEQNWNQASKRMGNLNGSTRLHACILRNEDLSLLTAFTVESAEACFTVTQVAAGLVLACSIVLTWLRLTFVDIWEERFRVVEDIVMNYSRFDEAHLRSCFNVFIRGVFFFLLLSLHQ